MFMFGKIISKTHIETLKRRIISIVNILSLLSPLTINFFYIRFHSSAIKGILFIEFIDFKGDVERTVTDNFEEKPLT